MITSRRQTITMAIPLGSLDNFVPLRCGPFLFPNIFFRINKKPEQSKVIKLLIVQVQ